MNNKKISLAKFIDKEITKHVAAEVTMIADNIRQNHEGVEAILFYGSGLWKAIEKDTIFDLYLLVKNYRNFHRKYFPALFGRILPPNVYYMEIPHGEHTLRCKYAVMRIDQFSRNARGKSLTPQIWARFAQPSRLIFTSNDNIKRIVTDAITESVITFHRKILPLCKQVAGKRQTSIAEMWIHGLTHTYSTELRSEKFDRAKEIFESIPKNFASRTELALQQISDKRYKMINNGNVIDVNISYYTHYTAKFLGFLQKVSSKLIAFLRLCKAIFTFTNAVEYAMWKIERHSGVRIKPSPFQRRHPLIGAWLLLWKAYRCGGFR